MTESELDQVSELIAERNAWRELAKARGRLLVAYRLNDSRKAGPAIDACRAAEVGLDALDASWRDR